jgi:hypothetical protein
VRLDHRAANPRCPPVRWKPWLDGGTITEEFLPDPQAFPSQLTGIELITARKYDQDGVVSEPTEAWPNILSCERRRSPRGRLLRQLEVLGCMADVTTETHCPVLLEELLHQGFEEYEAARRTFPLR